MIAEHLPPLRDAIQRAVGRDAAVYWEGGPAPVSNAAVELTVIPGTLSASRVEYTPREDGFLEAQRTAIAVLTLQIKVKSRMLFEEPSALDISTRLRHGLQFAGDLKNALLAAGFAVASLPSATVVIPEIDSGRRRHVYAFQIDLRVCVGRTESLDVFKRFEVETILLDGETEITEGVAEITTEDLDV